MARFGLEADLSERQQLLGGGIALLAATACVVALGTNGLGRGLPGVLVGLASVGLLVVGTLSIGTSRTARV